MTVLWCVLFVIFWFVMTTIFTGVELYNEYGKDFDEEDVIDCFIENLVSWWTKAIGLLIGLILKIVSLPSILIAGIISSFDKEKEEE